jgi:hypothetical protein
LAAREPLPIDILKRHFDWSETELSTFRRSLGTLFTVGEEHEIPTVRPFHGSLSGWLSDMKSSGSFFVSINRGHLLLAQYCLAAYSSNVKSMPAFCIRHAPYHLLKAEQWTHLAMLMRDSDFLDIRLRAGMGYELLCFFEDAINHWPRGQPGLSLVTSQFEFLKSGGVARSRDWILPNTSVSPMPAYVEPLLDEFAHCDAFSLSVIDVPHRRHCVGRRLLFLASLIFGSYVLYGRLSYISTVVLLIADGLLLNIALWIHFLWLQHSQWWRRYLDLRLHAECIRILLFWRLAGIADRRAEEFLKACGTQIVGILDVAAKFLTRNSPGLPLWECGGLPRFGTLGRSPLEFANGRIRSAKVKKVAARRFQSSVEPEHSQG